MTMDLIVWDEALNSHRADVEGVDRLFRELTGNPNIPFGGEYETVDATLGVSPLWQRMTHYELHHPVRDAEDAEYSAFVDSLGDGTAPVVGYSDNGAPFVQLHPVVPFICDRDTAGGSSSSLDAFIDSVYSDLTALLHHPERFADHAILCPLNSRVQEINQRMTERMQPRTYMCRSFDKRHDTADSIHPDMIDLLGQRSGVPPHELVLFVGAIVSVMRNLDIVARPCHVMVLAAAARSMAPPLREASLPRSRRCLGPW